MKTHEYVIHNRAGKRMPATLYVPEDARGTALVLHGVGGWREQPVVIAAATALTEEGYATLVFDAADGPLGPDGDFYNSTISGYLSDIEDVVAWMKTQDWYRTPLLLAGHSVGGFGALRHATSHADADALLLIAPMLSWKSGLLKYAPYVLWWLIIGSRPSFNPVGQFKKLKPLGRNWILDFFKYDGYQDAPHCRVPALIISAGRDGTVATPGAHRRFARRLPTCTQVTVPGARHDFRGHEVELAATIRQWLTSS